MPCSHALNTYPGDYLCNHVHLLLPIHTQAPQPYNFGYKIDDGYGNNQHQEESGDTYGNKKGSYGFTDAYGIYRKVDYIADEGGFRATISTNEPGTADSHPADAKIISAPAVVAAAPAYHAPVYAAPAYHAPVYAPRPHGHYAPSHAAPIYRAGPVYKAAPVYSAPVYAHAAPAYGTRPYKGAAASSAASSA